MKLKDRFKCILRNNDENEIEIKKINKKKIIAFIIASVVIIIMSIIGIVYHYNHNKKLKESIRQQEQYELEQYIDNYHKHCDDYDRAVEAYNLEAERINSFLKEIESYNVINKTDSLPLKSNIERVEAESKQDRVDFNLITGEIDVVNSETEALRGKYSEICQLAYNGVLNEYNMLAEAYNKLSETTSIDFIEDIPERAELKEDNLYDISNSEFTEEDLLKEIADISEETKSLVSYYLLKEQITNPDEQWVKECLERVNSVTGVEAVTQTNDPNKLLGKEGGYTGCIYFTVNNINSSDVKGASIVDKGTDAGGAIEIYPTLETALNRCDYLSQFDNTLLYSGSYAIIGTMVVRTSYKLTDQEQVDLTNEITNVLTEIK